MAASPIYFDPRPLRVHAITIIVKYSAVVRSYPGGIAQFLARYRTPYRSGELIALSCMSLGSAGQVLAGLESVGIIPGQDVALCDIHRGPVVPCDGIRLEEANPGEVPALWFAYFDASYTAPGAPAEPTGPSELPAISDRADAQEPTGAEKPPQDTSGRPLTFVAFRTGPIHWVYDDDEED